MAKNLTEGSPARLILFFTLPLIAGNIFQQMYAFVDTLIVGRFLGVQALAAVGCTGSLMFLMIGFIMGTTTGLSICTGQRFGARDSRGVRRSAAACALLTLVIALVLTLLGWLSARPLLVLMQTPPEILEDAVSFISIIYGGAALMMFFAMQTNLIRALGDSQRPTYLLAFGLILNTVFEPVFIIVLGWGIPGAALATVVSQAVANVVCLIYIAKKVPALWIRKEDWKLTRKELLKHLRMGIPMGFQASVIALGAIILQVALNGLGPLAVAAYAAAQKIDMVAVMPMMSFGMAMAAYTAQNYGAQKFDRIKVGVKKCVMMSGAFSIAVGVFNILCGPFLMELFVGEGQQQVVDYGQMYLVVNGVCYFILSLLFIFRYTLQGLGQTVVPTIAGGMELFMRALAALVLVDWWGYFGACVANPLAWIGSCTPLAIAYWYVRKNSPNW